MFSSSDKLLNTCIELTKIECLETKDMHTKGKKESSN